MATSVALARYINLSSFPYEIFLFVWLVPFVAQNAMKGQLEENVFRRH